jgi:putative chitinase
MFYDRKRLFDSIRSKLTTNGKLSQSQVNGIELLVEEGESRGFNTEWIAYVLATAWHETGATMEPVRETFADTDEQAIARLNAAWRKGQLTWVKTPYWEDGYFGRGFVQLTHKYNYEKMGEWLKLDLVGKPSLALDRKNAAKIIYEGMLKGMFTGKALPEYLDGVDGTDAEDAREYTRARIIVNGKDKAKKIANYALKFEAALRGAEGVTPAPGTVAKSDPKGGDEDVTTSDDVVVMPPSPPSETKPAMQSTTIWAALGALTTTIVGVLGALPLAVQVMLVLLVAAFIFWIIRERMKAGKGIEGIFG